MKWNLPLGLPLRRWLKSTQAPRRCVRKLQAFGSCKFGVAHEACWNQKDQQCFFLLKNLSSPQKTCISKVLKLRAFKLMVVYHAIQQFFLNIHFLLKLSILKSVCVPLALWSSYFTTPLVPELAFCPGHATMRAMVCISVGNRSKMVVKSKGKGPSPKCSKHSGLRFVVVCPESCTFKLHNV